MIDSILRDESHQMDRSSLSQMLYRWWSGHWTAKQVYAEAMRLWSQTEWPDYPSDDERSVAIELLFLLNMLPHTLLSTEDVPAMLAFLDTPPGEELSGWARWDLYLSRVDWSARTHRASGQAGHLVA